MKTRIAAAVAFPMSLLSAAPAVADCTKAEVQWLQSVGYAPSEAMAWCIGAPAPSQAGKTASQATPLHKEPPRQATRPMQQPAPQEIGRAPLQDKAAEEDKDTKPLGSFKVSSSNGSNLVTARVATAYTPAFMGTFDRTHWLSRLGLDVSASLPAETTTLKEYGRQALMTLDGGVLNVYASLAGRDRKYYKPELADGVPNPRDQAFDHLYLVKRPKSQEQLLAYLKLGMGGRAVKTALEGTGFAGVATAYLGLGLDGPLLTERWGARTDTTGWFNIEAVAVANLLNKRTLTTIFEEPYAKRSFSSVGAKAVINLPGRFFLSAQYAKALGSYGRAFIGDISVISFGYNTQ